MSFFIRNNNNNNNKNNKKTKKKLVKNRQSNGGVKKAKLGQKKKDKRQLDDEEILSDDLGDSDDDELEIVDSDQEPSSRKKSKKAAEDDEDSELGSEDDDELETAQEKKIRLAKQYLTELENREKERELSDEEDAEDENLVHRSNMISAHLKDNILQKSGQLHRKVADRYRLLPPKDASKSSILLKNGHRKTITCCIVSYDGRFVFTGSKDCSIIKWDSITGKRIRTIFGNHRKDPEQYHGHTGTVMALAVTSDFKFLASGCVNRMIHIWKPADLSYLHTFRGHREAITGLSFRRSFHQLFSCSSDRMVKVWNLDEMAYIESLFGHHDSVTSIDSFVRERAITSGGRDGTIRLWKIPEESHLIYLTGGDATVDSVRFVDENHFLSACDNGTVSIWGLFKKKPLASLKQAHGPNMWITAIASLRNTDLFATGNIFEDRSYNGKISFWKLANEFRSIEKLFDYDVTGFVNSLEFTPDGKFLVASVGQEHRLGRWWRIKEARNVVHVIPLPQNDEQTLQNNELNNSNINEEDNPIDGDVS